MKIEKYRVCVRCTTYNHSDFILKTLEGFCIQETSFPYVCMIVDDFSTDNTQGIIKSFLTSNSDLIKQSETADYCFIHAQHKTNKNCYFVLLFLKYNHYKIKKSKSPYMKELEDNSDYLAICEGDDFWTNSKKLQMQVDFLDANPDYSMCFGDVILHHVDGSNKDIHCNKYHKKANRNLDKSKEKSFYSILCSVCRIQTLSVMLRTNCYLNRTADSHVFMMGDTQLWLDMSQFGKIGYFEDCLGVYNIHTGSATNNSLTRKRFTLSAKEMCVYYCEKYGYKVPLQKKIEYNLAYYDLLLSNNCHITPPPLFTPFFFNKLHEFVLSHLTLKWLKKVFLIEKNMYLFFIRIRSVFLQICNIL